MIGDKKLSHRIAKHLEDMGVAEIGDLSMLSLQHATQPAQRKKMIFINDCTSSCVKLLTHGFDSDQYLYIDVSQHKNSPAFDTQHFIEIEILPKVSR